MYTFMIHFQVIILKVIADDISIRFPGRFK
jgi:hypothetical protein